MKKGYLFHTMCLCTLLGLASCNQTSIDQDDSSQGGSVAQPAVWAGPGFYYGVWFSTEFQFNDYHERHYHPRDRDRDRDRESRDHSRDEVPRDKRSSRDLRDHSRDEVPKDRGADHRGSGRGR